MKFFDYIFISWYRVYKEYESKKHNQRFRATMALLLCIVSIVALLVGIINRLYSLQPAMEFLLDHYYLVVILACASMFLTYNIYTEERIARINEDYENQYLFMKQLWIWISLGTCAACWTFFALILNHVIF